jgi:hypothetical protein
MTRAASRFKFCHTVPVTPPPRDRPTASERRWFGVLLLGVAAVFSAVLVGVAHAEHAAIAVAALGTLACALYYALPALQGPLYRGWMRLVFPLGWLVSHALLALVFYGLITPMALGMRLFRRDALRLRRPAPGESLWVAHDPGGEPERYFRQT